MEKIKFTNLNLKWINEPSQKSLVKDKNEVTIVTEAKTDFWQRTHYGFRNDNAPALICQIDRDFTFLIKTKFNSKKRYDQCGIIIYQNSDNWFKASIEYEDEKISRLGSVVTNLGYSDWATTDISTEINSMYYRLSRRGQDFLIENSYDGTNYHQMRIFHMHEKIIKANVGIYACSPLDSSFESHFEILEISDCIWK